MRLAFVSNSSCVSFLLGIKGKDIRDAVMSFFDRHDAVFGPVIQDLREGMFRDENPEVLEVEADVEAIADLIKHSSMPFNPNDAEIYQRLGKTSQKPEYLAFVKERAKRQLEKGLSLYWTSFLEDALPGRLVYFLFDYTDRKFHEDNEFCFLWMPAER